VDGTRSSCRLVWVCRGFRLRRCTFVFRRRKKKEVCATLGRFELIGFGDESGGVRGGFGWLVVEG